MTVINHQPRKKGFLNGTLSILIIFVVITFITSCTKSPKPYSIIKFEGPASIMNYTKNLFLISYYADSASSADLLAEDGDLFLLEDNFLYIHDNGPDSVKFTEINGAGYVNGKLYSLTVPGKDSACVVLQEALKEDITELRILNFESSVPKSCIPMLEELALANTEIALFFESSVKGIEALIELFNPKILSVASVSKDVLKLLAGNNSPEILIAGIGEDITEQLPAMPALKKLVLCGSDKEEIPQNFFKKNPQIESLTIFNLDLFDFNQLKPLTGLKALLINDTDSIINQDLLGRHKSIEMLAVITEKFSCDSTLDDLNKIRWMAFSPAIVQKDFTRFIDKHPSLEVVEILGNKEITSLESLRGLKRLYGLSITNEIIDTVTPLSLQNLKYLSLPEDYLEDSLKITELRRSLPNTTIVANEGFCLGSGWLLLLLPFIILLRFFRLNRKS